MKMRYIILILALGLTFNANAQENKSNRVSQIWLRTYIQDINRNITVHGYLYEAKDSVILVSKYNVVKDYNINEKNLMNISIRNVEKCAMRKVGNKQIGAIVGGCSGLAIGLMLTKKKGFDMAGPIFTAVGFGFGISIGSFKKVIPINYSLTNYGNYKNEFEVRSIKEIRTYRYGKR